MNFKIQGGTTFRTIHQCSSVISVAVKKYPDKRQHRLERVYHSLQFQVTRAGKVAGSANT